MEGCVRCGGNHDGRQCKVYPYYEGPACEICHKLHPTKFHKGRSTSKENLNKPEFKYRNMQQYQADIEQQSEQSSEQNIFRKN